MSRKLDAEIAKTVFGYNVVGTKSGAKNSTHVYYTIEEPWWGDFAGDMQLMNAVPCYSTDIAAAMEVFQYLRDSGKWCCLNILSDYKYCWTVSLKEETIGTFNPPHRVVISVDDESLPVAICRAALKACDGEST